MNKIKSFFASMNSFFNSMADKQFEVKQESFNNVEFHGGMRNRSIR